MIFWFSGTGNSEWVARLVADGLRDELVFIPKVDMDREYVLKAGEKLGFVFPCYAWGVPAFVADFIRRVKITGVGYTYYLSTCGDDTGRLKEEVCSLFASRGWQCCLGYEVKMPESYVCLPGFDIDPKDKERSKCNKAVARVEMAVDDILDSRQGVFETLPGIFPRTKSGLLRWGFNKWLMTAKHFWTLPTCTGCGTCESVCPMKNIKLVDGRVAWGDNCVMCLRCYHSCPQHALHWGKYTQSHGQYPKV